MNNETKNMSLVGYRKDYSGQNMQLFMNDDNEFKVKYKGDFRDVELSFLVVDKGRYNQEVDDLPYIILDNDVYTIESFESLH